MSRVERALARIEAAAERAPATPADDGRLEQLREAHAMLRGRVQGAIDEIDALLVGQGGQS